jgi:hypothetical protein
LDYEELEVDVLLAQVLETSTVYGNVNYYAGRYFMRRYFMYGAPEDLSKSEAFYKAQALLYPYDFHRMLLMMDDLIRAGQLAQVNMLYSVINKGVLNFERHRFAYKSQEENLLLNQWLNELNTSESSLALAHRLLGNIKGRHLLDLLIGEYASSTSYFMKHNHYNFHAVDLDYWRQVMAIHTLGHRGDTGEATVNAIMNEVQLVKGQDFSWPGEIISSGKGNSLSIACLLRAALHSRGDISFMLKIETLNELIWLVYGERSGEGFLYNPEKNTFVKGKFSELLEKPRLSEVVAADVKNTEIVLFDFPQAFCQRNVFLSKVISSKVESIPDFCSNPSVVALNLQRYLGGKWKIRYLKEPFIKLESSLK